MSHSISFISITNYIRTSKNNHVNFWSSTEGESAKELLDDFHGAVDDYLETCKAEGKEPEVAFKGSFNIRLSPDLHKKLFIYTTAHQISMNKYIENTLEDSPAAKIIV